LPWQDGSTPLHQAARYDYVDIVPALLARGADVNAKNNVRRATRHRPRPLLRRVRLRCGDLRRRAAAAARAGRAC
jgi:ankyrin repeat protein